MAHDPGTNRGEAIFVGFSRDVQFKSLRHFCHNSLKSMFCRVRGKKSLLQQAEEIQSINTEENAETYSYLYTNILCGFVDKYLIDTT